MIHIEACTALILALYIPYLVKGFKIFSVKEIVYLCGTIYAQKLLSIFEM